MDLRCAVAEINARLDVIEARLDRIERTVADLLAVAAHPLRVVTRAAPELLPTAEPGPSATRAEVGGPR